jgi:chromosome partitioning protein
MNNSYYAHVRVIPLGRGRDSNTAQVDLRVTPLSSQEALEAMLSDAAHPYSQHKIVILNPKGGSGKTTLATNLASYFAMRGPPPTLVDADPGGYSLRWNDKRPADRPPVHAIAGYDQGTYDDRDISRIQDSKEVIVDLPAGLTPEEMFDHIYDASSILLPIVPSEIDIHSAAKFIGDLLLFTQLDRRKRNLAIVANRTRQHTKSYAMLTRFLTSLNIPVVARLRDSQAFVHATAFGVGICEMQAHKVRQDMEQLELIVSWLDRWRSRQLDRLIADEIGRNVDHNTLTPAVAMHQ